MAHWSKKEPEFAQMASIIAQQPGISPGELAKQLGLATSTITRRLPDLEEAEHLLYEDDKGGLWPFRRKT